MPQVVILATTPSPYQAELFDAVAAAGEFGIQVVYMVRQHSDRLWDAPDLRHNHIYWTDGPEARSAARRAFDTADLAVFAWYADSAARSLMRQRAQSGRPWVYWGERPGFRGWRWLGRMRRRIQLAPLHRQPVPIWGMGSWAVAAWLQEFGERRTYENVPYFSDLDRFAAPSTRPRAKRRFLYSGALIPRKGVDLLADAFSELARQRPDVRLDIVGQGHLEVELKQKLASVASQVRFLGFRQWSQLPSSYHDADILIAPSRYDGWGLIVPEGLAAGLPVIATDQMGAALELVRPRVNGWCIAAGDAEALAKAMAEAADLPDSRLAEMSAAALASVAQHRLADGVRTFSDAAWAALRSPVFERPLCAS
jgi:glycosyltransferase involved in cell wall biosynthesis